MGSGRRLHVFGQRRGQTLQLQGLILPQSGAQGEGVLQLAPTLEIFQDFLHFAAAGRRPGAVFQQHHAAIPQAVGGDVPQQLLHGDEHAAVVSVRSEDQMAVLERGGENIGRRGHGGVEHLHPYPLLRQAAGQNVGGALRVAVDGGVGDHHAAHLRLIAAPKVVLAHIDGITDHLAAMTKQERIAWFRRSTYVQPLNFLREIDGTTYAVRAFFSEDARENITEKVQRIIPKSDNKSKEI